MQRAPNPQRQMDRLRALRTRFAEQEQFMASALRDLREQLETWRGQDNYATAVHDLRAATYELGNDLRDVRMAIVGATELLASHQELDQHVHPFANQRLGA